MPTEHPDIFRLLTAPFPKDQERTRPQGAVTLTYITARCVQNRLDEVIGAENWWCHYEETRDGIKCFLTLRMPDGREVTKEDGGGFATAMKAEDDVEKSGYSDAFKRAGVAWGVGRYLYRDGVPRYDAAPPDRRETPKPKPAPPKQPKPDYKEWLDSFVADIDAKWTAAHPGGKSLLNAFQLNGHLIKHFGDTSGPADFKAGERLWNLGSGDMAAEAVEYCRRLWREATAKLNPAPTPEPAREPGQEG